MRRLLKKKKLLSRRKTDFVEKKSIGIGGNLWYNWLRCPRGHLRLKNQLDHLITNISNRTITVEYDR